MEKRVRGSIPPKEEKGPSPQVRLLSSPQRVRVLSQLLFVSSPLFEIVFFLSEILYDPLHPLHHLSTPQRVEAWADSSTPCGVDLL
jgi:hypothetical protein